MKKFFRMFGASALFAGMIMAAGCGDDSSSGSTSTTGTVAKGPVSGAVVKYSDGTAAGTTSANGQYTNSKGLAVTTTGGAYFDMNNKYQDAPNMATPAGKANVTPLTTLYVSVLTNPVAKANLDALLGVGVSIDTVVTGTITSANLLIAKLNETIGAILTQNKTITATQLANMATALGNLKAADITGGTAWITTLATASGLTGTALDSVVAYATSIANAAIVGATVPSSGPTPTTTTTTTSGSTTTTAATTSSTGGTTTTTTTSTTAAACTYTSGFMADGVTPAIIASAACNGAKPPSAGSSSSSSTSGNGSVYWY